MFEKLKEKKKKERDIEELHEFLDMIINKYGHKEESGYSDISYIPQNENYIYCNEYIQIYRCKSVNYDRELHYYKGKQYSITIDDHSSNYFVNWNTGDDMIEDEALKYLVSIPRYEHKKELQKLQMEKEKIIKNAKEKKEKEQMKEAALRSKHIIEAINYLRDYEDYMIKIERKIQTVYSSEDGDVDYVQCINVILKQKNMIVFNEVGDDGKYVYIYRPGKWEQHLINVYNRELYIKTKRNYIKEENKKITEEEQKQKRLKFERERYLPIDD